MNDFAVPIDGFGKWLEDLLFGGSSQGGYSYSYQYSWDQHGNEIEIETEHETGLEL